MPVRKSQQDAVNRYIGKNYDRVNLTLPRGRKQDVEAHASAKGESVNGLVNDLLRRDIGMTEEEWKKKDKGGEADANA